MNFNLLGADCQVIRCDLGCRIMLEISGLSDRFTVRRLTEADAGAVLALCRENGQFYQYCKARPTLAQVLSDMRVAPPGVDRSCKHYVGFYEGPELVSR